MSQKKIDWENLPIGTPLRCIDPTRDLKRGKIYLFNKSCASGSLCLRVQGDIFGYWQHRFELAPVDLGEPGDNDE